MLKILRHYLGFDTVRLGKICQGMLSRAIYGSGYFICQFLNLKSCMEICEIPGPFISTKRTIQGNIINGVWRLAVSSGNVLCYNVTANPCLKTIINVFFAELNASSRKVHRMGRPM